MGQVWQGASQVRNDLKKKAKQIVDESYGFTGLKPQKCEALAAWLSSTHRQTLKSGKVVKVPNFIFPVASVVWQEGQKGKGSGTIDENKVSTALVAVTLLTCTPERAEQAHALPACRRLEADLRVLVERTDARRGESSPGEVQ